MSFANDFAAEQGCFDFDKARVVEERSCTPQELRTSGPNGRFMRMFFGSRHGEICALRGPKGFAPNPSKIIPEIAATPERDSLRTLLVRVSLC